MEPYEKLKNLPESEKAKYFEVFLESFELASDGSNDPEKNSVKKLSLGGIFNEIASGPNTSSDGSPRKKQKTLDSWLIKPKAPHKNETGKSSYTSEGSSCVISNSDRNNAPASLNSTQSNLNDENVLSSSKTKENCSKRLDCSPTKCDKVHNSCYVKVVPISLSHPEITNSTHRVSQKHNLKSKTKLIQSSQLSDSKSVAQSATFIDKSNFDKSSEVITQSHISNNSDADHDVSPEKDFEQNSNILINESSHINSTLSSLNNLNDKISSSPSKLHKNNFKNLEHLPCKSDKVSNNYKKDVKISQPEDSELTHFITKKGNSRSKRKCTENISLDKSSTKITKLHLTHNSDVDHNVPEHNSNATLKESNIILNSDINNVPRSPNSTPSELNNSSDETSLNSSKCIENNSQNVEHLPYKSDKICDNFTKDVQISKPENSQLTGSKKRNSKLKRKCSELSEPENSTKTSIFTDNISLNKSDEVLMQLSVTNTCNVNPDVCSENIVSEPSNLAGKNDSQDVNNSCPFIKGTRNLRSRNVTINLPKIIRSSTKVQQDAAKNVDFSERNLSPKKNDSIDSSLLHNQHREAFKVLEKMCSRANISIVDILQDASVQNILNNPDMSDNETFFIINALKLSNEETVPSVYFVHSRKEFSELLKKRKKSL